MSMDLYNDNGHVKIATLVWENLLALGQLGGWQPAGVKLNEALLRDRLEWLPEHEVETIIAQAKHKTLDYNSNDGDILSGADATNLATALATMLDDIPDIDMPKQYRPRLLTVEPGEEVWQAIERSILQNNPIENPLEFFSGRLKPLVDEMIEYLATGGDTTLL